MNNNKFQTNPKEKKSIERLIAWNIMPLYYDKGQIAYICGIPQYKLDYYINELISEGRIKIVNDNYGWYKKIIMPSNLLIETLTEIAEKNIKVRNVSKPGYDYDDYYTKHWVDLFKSYALSIGGYSDDKIWKNKLNKYVSEELGKLKTYTLNFYNQELQLVASLPLYKEWRPLFNALPKEIQINAIDLLLNKYEYNLEAFSNEVYEAYVQALSSSNKEILEYYLTKSATINFVMKARIDDIPRFVQEHEQSYMSSWLNGFYYQRKGDIDQASNAYSKANFEGNLNPLYILNYAWFVYKFSSNSKIELGRLKKEVTNYGNEYLCILLFINSLTETGIKTCLSKIDKHFNEFTLLSKIITLFVLNYFNIKSIDRNIAEALYKIEYKLLALDFGRYLGLSQNESDNLEKECGFAPLLLYVKPKELWEIALDEATKCISKSLGTVSNDNPSSSRIIYIIDKYFGITPKLQTRKANGGWTAGKKLVLNIFQTGTGLEFNEVDRKVANGVIKKWDYSIDPTVAMPALIGYPLVFDEYGESITIRKEELQVTLVRTPDNSFKFETNVGKFKEGVYVYFRRIRNEIFVIELDTLQSNFFTAVSKVEDFPAEAETALKNSLQLISRAMPLQSDLMADEDLKEIESDSTINLLLRYNNENLTADIYVKPLGSAGPLHRPGKGPSVLVGKLDGTATKTIRNIAEELSNYESLLSIVKSVNCDKDNYCLSTYGLEDSLELMDIIGQHIDNLKIEWREDKKLNIISRSDFSNMSLSINGLNHWFQIQGEIKLDDGAIIQMKELMKLLNKSDSRFIEISSGEFIALTDRFRKQLNTLSSVVSVKDGRMAIPSFVASVVSKMGENGMEINENDPSFSELISRIDKASKTIPLPPKQLKAELRDYQVDGYRWLSRLSSWGTGAILADDMGLGKTIQAIAILLSKAAEGASLVIAPASVMPNWEKELSRFAPSLKVHKLNDSGTDRQKIVLNAKKSDIVLTTYGVAQKEDELITSRQWNIIILDEAHAIKNSETKTSRTIMKLQSAFNLLLTGTPIQNNLLELWNLFNFAAPGLLGSREHFMANATQLKRLILPFILRRTKEQVLDELPPKTEITMSVPLSEGEMALYESFRQDAVKILQEGENPMFEALAVLTKMRLACCHPALIDSNLGLGSSKSDMFIELVEELMRNNHRALVFSQFTSHLALIQDRLDKENIPYLYLDGSTSIKKRSALVDEFQSGDVPIFLISLKAGGLGINLTAADYVIHLDPWWNPAIEDQASDRTHRIGQTKPVTVYRLIAQNTVEEKIMSLHESKKQLSETILSGSDTSHNITREDLLMLL